MFDRSNLTKKKVWQIIAKKFSEKCKSSVDWSQLKGKWAKLERKFKDVKSVNGKSGSGRREFLYEREMEEAIGGNPNITPMATYSSMNDECVGENSVCENSNSLSKKPNVSEGVKRKRENMYELLSGKREEKKKQHEEKMEVMNKFLNIFSKMVPGNSEQ
ncbi:hypothetical protein KP79_PYT23826 [Mizuhopecten yessoensis]|uniref:Myb/SANT-like DNA-binding domain-containing protein n=1 Tax=Mizuhopecten yessoensis TaxID=6573 RepID=A0A210R1E8_MIZYE|nr:hypothetical protein KP79_PYT23826 [Mizuhopecten yessoensis]